MKIKKYIVEDLQGTGFFAWTWVEPQTRAEILMYFRGFADDTDINLRPGLGFRDIYDTWQMKIHLVDIPIVPCQNCECPMHRNKCPSCTNRYLRW
jgi:hypothetical protein